MTLMKKTILSIIIPCLGLSMNLHSQECGLVDMSKSENSIMSNNPVGPVKWTGGFWGERFNIYSNVSLQSMWNT